jgi:hypothetical protein
MRGYCQEDMVKPANQALLGKLDRILQMAMRTDIELVQKI